MKDNIFSKPGEDDPWVKQAKEQDKPIGRYVQEDPEEFDKTKEQHRLWMDSEGSIRTGYIIADHTPQSFVFSDRNGNPMLTLVEDGTILVRGKYQAKDEEVVSVLRAIVAQHLGR